MRAVTVLVAVTCAVLLVGCSGADTGGSDDGAAFSVLAGLAEIPVEVLDGLLAEAGDAQESVGVSVDMADLSRAAGVAGVDRPVGSRDGDQVSGLLSALTGRGSPGDAGPYRAYVPLPFSVDFERVDEIVDEIGFSVADADWYLFAGRAPRVFSVMGGVNAVGGLAEVAPGVFTLGEGEDLRIPTSASFRPTALRPLGRVLRVAERDGKVATSTTTPPIVAWRAGKPGGGFSELVGLGPIGEILDSHDVYAASISIALDANRTSIVGIGWGADTNGPFAVVVRVFDSIADAERALPIIKSVYLNDTDPTSLQPLTDDFDLTAAEVVDRTVVATVRFPTGLPGSVFRVRNQVTAALQQAAS
jgi:hypothetical protein